MAKQIQLHISEPCHESWDTMTPDEKGRFCGSCQKQVIDFSTMSDRQIAEFFKKPSTGSVCGRFMSDQLDRGIDVPKKRIPWLKYFFHVAIPAFLVSLKASAIKAPAQRQEQASAMDTTRKPGYDDLKMMGTVARSVPVPETRIDTAVVPIKEPLPMVKGKIALQVPKDTLPTCSFPLMGAVVMREPVQADAGKQNIRGRVTDQQGRSVAFAHIQYGKEKTPVMTAEDGVFSFRYNRVKKGITVTVSAAGFETLVTQLPDEITGEWLITLSANDRLPERPPRIMGEITMGKPMLVDADSSIKKEECVQNSKHVDRADKNENRNLIRSFQLSPNPVAAGTSVVWNGNKLDKGLHQLEFFQQSGQLLLVQEILIGPGKGSGKFDVPFVPAGSYFLVLTNKQNGSRFSAKLVVQ